MLVINIIDVIILINKILEYSARNRSINDFLLNSILNPDTSSDSPSEKSNGVRLVSAKTVIIHMIIIIGIIIIIGVYFCDFCIIEIFICSVMFIIVIKIIIKLISYEIIWAIVRIIPINE